MHGNPSGQRLHFSVRGRRRETPGSSGDKRGWTFPLRSVDASADALSCGNCPAQDYIIQSEVQERRSRPCSWLRGVLPGPGEGGTRQCPGKITGRGEYGTASLVRTVRVLDACSRLSVPVVCSRGWRGQQIGETVPGSTSEHGHRAVCLLYACRVRRPSTDAGTSVSLCSGPGQSPGVGAQPVRVFSSAWPLVCAQFPCIPSISGQRRQFSLAPFSRSVVLPMSE